jgi:hypothetical protein
LADVHRFLARAILGQFEKQIFHLVVGQIPGRMTRLVEPPRDVLLYLDSTALLDFIDAMDGSYAPEPGM